MSNVPSELKYTKTHEWIRTNDDDSVTIGITDHAQHLLGDVVFLEFPKVGEDFEAEAEILVVESVKAAADIYSPLSGKVLEINSVLLDSPELVNSDPYGEGWVCRLQPTARGSDPELLSSQNYQEQLESE